MKIDKSIGASIGRSALFSSYRITDEYHRTTPLLREAAARWVARILILGTLPGEESLRLQAIPSERAAAELAQSISVAGGRHELASMRERSKDIRNAIRLSLRVVAPHG